MPYKEEGQNLKLATDTHRHTQTRTKTNGKWAADQRRRVIVLQLSLAKPALTRAKAFHRPAALESLRTQRITKTRLTADERRCFKRILFKRIPLKWVYKKSTNKTNKTNRTNETRFY